MLATAHRSAAPSLQVQHGPRDHDLPTSPHAAGRLRRRRHAPAWWRHVREVITAEAGRRDLREHLLAYAWLLAKSARGDGTTTLVRTKAADQLGLTERTVARLRARLEALGLLVVLEHGSTPSTRGGHHPAAGQDGNRCAVYALTIPVDPADAPQQTSAEVLPQNRILRNVTPPLSTERGNKITHARVRDTRIAVAERAATRRDDDLARRRLRRDGSPTRGQTRTDQLLLAAKVRHRAQTLAEAEHLPWLAELLAVSTPWLASLLRQAGLLELTPDQVVYVVGHAPDGSLRTAATTPEHPVAVLRWRLKAWGQLIDAMGLERALAGHAAQQQRLEAVRARRAAEAAERQTASAVLPPIAQHALAALREANARRRCS
ncbi:hypothetical protein [Kineococcus radiotolerans]|uniref:Helix-turn-helix domain-containing protein n=1 Tax=Kineococcus radiotolerans (strain ATCC BAA-149 / DSM 14245 / SRS30216) TaxID=266940 RepID=A6WH75_KINRD|nr:hypothetical protein [Kineococcus radiotolerans]ABS06164.1 hypothetical protein Krad_4706 [Kineococcus radiotolerans SRS30216 = ATCC BAA-149]